MSLPGLFSPPQLPAVGSDGVDSVVSEYSTPLVGHRNTTEPGSEAAVFQTARDVGRTRGGAVVDVPFSPAYAAKLSGDNNHTSRKAGGILSALKPTVPTSRLGMAAASVAHATPMSSRTASAVSGSVLGSQTTAVSSAFVHEGTPFPRGAGPLRPSAAIATAPSVSNTSEFSVSGAAAGNRPSVSSFARTSATATRPAETTTSITTTAGGPFSGPFTAAPSLDKFTFHMGETGMGDSAGIPSTVAATRGSPQVNVVGPEEGQGGVQEEEDGMSVAERNKAIQDDINRYLKDDSNVVCMGLHLAPYFRIFLSLLLSPSASLLLVIPLPALSLLWEKMCSICDVVSLPHTGKVAALSAYGMSDTHPDAGLSLHPTF